MSYKKTLINNYFIMKKVFAIFGLAISSILFSCSENESINSSKEIVNESKISQVLNEKDYESQKLMYNNLSSDEKYKLWNDKIEKIINKNNLNEEQKTLLQELKKNMFVGIFDETENNDKAEIFKNIYVKDFLKKASKIFNREFIRANFYYISKISSERRYSGESSCSCNIGATFTCTYRIECRSLQTCRSSTSGCGFLGAFECNGNCDVLNPN